MRTCLVAMIVGLLTTSTLAQQSGLTTATFRERLNSCVAAWYKAPTDDRGTMTYRQYTQKCVSGKPALPINTSALCQNGEIALGSAPGGACSSGGGVQEWVN